MTLLMTVKLRRINPTVNRPRINPTKTPFWVRKEAGFSSLFSSVWEGTGVKGGIEADGVGV